MWDYNRINKQRDAYCAREGIDASQRAEFRDLGSESPLFRYVVMLDPRRSAQLSINPDIRFKDQNSRTGSVDTEGGIYLMYLYSLPHANYPRSVAR
jgi:hypothetical protein